MAGATVNRLENSEAERREQGLGRNGIWLYGSGDSVLIVSGSQHAEHYTESRGALVWELTEDERDIRVRCEQAAELRTF